MRINGLLDGFASQLAELLDAEAQLVGALPRLMAVATDGDVRHALESQLEETQRHTVVLSTLIRGAGLERPRHRCQPMRTLIADADRIAGSVFVSDPALARTAQRIALFTAGSYESAASLAVAIGREDATRSLTRLLDEARATGRRLARHASSGGVATAGFAGPAFG